MVRLLTTKKCTYNYDNQNNKYKKIKIGDEKTWKTYMGK